MNYIIFCHAGMIEVSILLMLFTANGAGAAVLTVNASGGAIYTGIQDAINDSSDGDTILVDSGTYHEHVNITKRLILRSVNTGHGKPVVDADMNGNAITLSADGIMLEGFNATNASSWYAGIMVISNNSVIIDNDVSKNNYGIFLDNSVNSTIYASNVTGNGMAFIVFSSANNTFHDNNVSDNYLSFYLYYTSNNTIYNNIFNNTRDLYMVGENANIWNITETPGAGITGGSYIGGNFWAKPDGQGFSQTCMDMNRDWFCDSSYILDNGTDQLPLAEPPPAYINGTVLDNGTGIANAIVSTGTDTTYANASGFYSLLLISGTYDLTAFHEPEYYPNSSVIVTVAAGTTVVQDIELLKKPAGNISGKVIKE